MTPPHGLLELQRDYGALVLGPDPRGGMRIASPAGWESANMAAVEFPGIARKMYVNRAIINPLCAALVAAEAACPDYQIRTIGCFCPRLKRVNGSLSIHTWGMAVDINADTNPLADTLITDMPPAFVQAFKDQGFAWGGEFSGKKDAMHFQWCSGY